MSRRAEGVDMKIVFSAPALRVARIVVSRVAAAALCMTLTLSANAQQVSSATSQDDKNEQLLRRIDQLEAKVKQLEERKAAPVSAPEPIPEPAIEGPRVNAVNDRLKLNIFGDVGYEASDLKPSSNTFEIGSLDMFMTARLSDKVSVLGEILFTAQNDNSINPDVEKLLL